MTLAAPKHLPWSAWARSHWYLGLMVAGFLCLFVPSVVRVWQGDWSSDENGHGPIVLALGLWLIWRKWPRGPLLRSLPHDWLLWTGFAAWAALYVFGRAFSVVQFELLGLLAIGACLVTLLVGWRGLRALWFPFFFLLFMIPLPGAIVDPVTMPLKLAVSTVSEHLMRLFDIPVAREGVVLFVGQYQLLVADACAGLRTVFMLEALGLFYVNVMTHPSAFRTITLAILVVPISFVANMIRVVSLCLVTLYLGDEAGQGFLHNFAGMVLFLSALVLIIGVDGLLRRIAASRAPATGGAR